MELKWPLLGLGLVALVAVLLVLWSRQWRRPRQSDDAVLVSHTELLLQLPRYRTLVRNRMLATAWRTVAVLVLIAGTILIASRPQTVEVSAPQESSRDIMLCLDASASMSDENVEVVHEVQAIVDGLEGERIGLTLFSGAAVTVFPLTDDYAFVEDQLDQAEEAFAENDYDYVVGTQLDDESASQMGDGLVSCVQRFDRPDQERGRAIILASDNDPQGPGIYTLPEAADYAVEKDVIVYGIGSPDLDYIEDKRAEFDDAVSTTGGTFSLLGETSADEVVEDIDTLERKRLEGSPRRTERDTPEVGVVIAAAGAGLLLVGWVVELLLTPRRRRTGGVQ